MCIGESASMLAEEDRKNRMEIHKENTEEEEAAEEEAAEEEGGGEMKETDLNAINVNNEEFYSQVMVCFPYSFIVTFFIFCWWFDGFCFSLIQYWLCGLFALSYTS